MAEVIVVGGGLAGSECAYQLAERGVQVRLIEQKPKQRTPAQEGDGLAELVCSNSFRSAVVHNAVGLLKEEMRRCGSLIIQCGDATRVPAGGAMAVDRDLFSVEVTRRIDEHPSIERTAEIVTEVPTGCPVVLATGPLTGDALARDLARLIGTDQLAYYDSVAPIITDDSLDRDKIFAASRYGKGEGDEYLNCPLDQAQYEAFVKALCEADKVTPHAFEEMRFFEGCLPVEVMAERGVDTLAYGPMKPVGLTDPRTGERPHAVVQLRRENTEGSAHNLVGFQTRMTQPEQRRVFGMIPGLEKARFERFGSVHRNTFINAPEVLDDTLALKTAPDVYLAGQITGVEGYIESAACGLVVGITLAARLADQAAPLPPPETALGALISHIRKPADDFQPSNVVWSMFPPMPGRRIRRRRERREALAGRALETLPSWSLIDLPETAEAG